LARELLPGELSWADSFIKDLLTEEEKYQDVIKDLSTDAIAATTTQLDRTSEEYLTGLEILINRATSSTSFVLVEVDDDVDDDASKASGDTGRANNEAYDETDWRLWDAVRDLDAALLGVNADIDGAVEQIKRDNEGFLSEVASWFGERFSDLDNLLSPLTDLVSDGIAWLFALPAQLLFESFKHFFFEETEE